MAGQYTKYNSGDTVRLKFIIEDFEGELVDPSIIIIKFYDSRYTFMSEVTLDAGNKVSKGIYDYDYESEETRTGDILYKIFATIEGKLSVKKGGMAFVF